MVNKYNHVTTWEASRSEEGRVKRGFFSPLASMDGMISVH